MHVAVTLSVITCTASSSVCSCVSMWWCPMLPLEEGMGVSVCVCE